MRNASTFAVCLAAFLGGGLLPRGAAAAPALALGTADVDLEKTSLAVDGRAEPSESDVVGPILGLSKGPEHAIGTRQARQWELRIVFKKPVAVGTALFLTSSPSRESAALLRPDFDGDPAKAADSDWLPIGPGRTLATKTNVRAVRLSGREGRWNMNAVRLLLLAPRLDGVTADAVGSGEAGPFGAHPNSIPRGEPWVNAAPDPNPGAAKQVPRGPVSDALPSWYVLAWDEPQKLCGLRVRGNAERYTLAVYRGDPKRNPALAGPRDWQTLPNDALTEVGGNSYDRFLALPPTEALAVRLSMTKTRDGAVASLERFDALVDLEERPQPTRGAIPAPFPIAYEQPMDGSAALVVVDAAGKPVRRLIAQVDRAKGPQVEHWDLRNDAGEIVPAGEYRWKAISGPPIELRYQFAVYPNVAMHRPDRLPWLTGESAPDGWLADHSSHTSVAVRGDRVYFAAPWVESGVSLVECDLTGKKLWARHSFAGFSGPDRIAAEGDAVYTLCRDKLERLDPTTRKWTPLGSTGRPGRGGTATGMAADKGKLYVAFHGRDPVFENAFRAEDVDLERCLPLYPERISDALGTRRVAPNPRLEFLRLLRLTGSPSGQGFPPKDRREGHFPIDLETVGDAREQFLVVAFKSPVPLGSVVFPSPGAEYRVEFAALKAGAAYPPDPRESDAWQPFPTTSAAAWTCVAAPPGTVARALRVRVTKAGEAKAIDDPLTELLDAPAKAADAPDLEAALDSKKPSAPLGEAAKAEWFARIEGMRLLRRRFEPVAGAQVRVSSGKVGPDGVWDAQRAEPLSVENPGVYLLEWETPQTLSGLAVKEIDGARTEVDVWEGAADGPIPLEGAAGWKNVAVYVQPRRDSYHPAFERNDCARYLDGMVDFGGVVKTRAVRLRVVAQWTDNGDRGTASDRQDREARSIDLRRCKVYGVLPLRALGGEPSLDPLAHQRIEVRDGATGAVEKELPVAAEGGLAMGPDGALFAVHAGRVFQVDPASGAARAVLPAVDGVEVQARCAAVGPDGSLFVFVTPQKVMQVYKPSGELVRTIGKPGGQKPGPWDPEKFLDVAALAVDARGGLWVVEHQNQPRRIVQFHPDGTLAAEHFGNTGYGGGGVLDRFDKTRLYYGRVQFELDWKTGASRVKNLLADYVPDDLVPARFQGRSYLASAPLSHQATGPTAYVYLLDEAAGTARAAAAFGEADSVELLQGSAVLAKLAAGKAPKDYTFLWADRDGDGAADPDEVVWELKPAGAPKVKLGRFNEAFRVQAGAWIYEAKEVLPSGAPVFVRRPASAEGMYELSDGRVLAMNEPDASFRDREANRTVVRDADGKPVWSYPTSHPSVSGLYLPPWRPGYVTNEFGVIGHETEPGGDLGEYFVTSGNNGRWNLWTADGMLAGEILRHKLDPRGRDLQTFRDGARGALLKDMTGGQEHFHAFLTRSEVDGRTYIVHGHNLIAVTEVTGLDRFRRLEGAISVSTEDLQRVRAWDAEQARREVKSRARLAECLWTKEETPQDAAEMEGAKLALGYDAENLYVRWTLEGQPAPRNSGTDFRRYFKTGAYVDLMLGADPAADGARRSPAEGDLRLLVTTVDGKPQAVLYEAVNPSAARDAWETRTPAGGTTRFDRVVLLPEAAVAVRTAKSGGCTVDATIPLAALHLRPAADQRLRFDWGVQTSDDGATAKRRSYWSNVLANGTTDEAVEARLEPHLWGELRFATQSAEESRLEAASAPGRGAKSEADALLEDLEKKP